MRLASIMGAIEAWGQQSWGVMEAAPPPNRRIAMRAAILALDGRFHGRAPVIPRAAIRSAAGPTAQA